MNDLLDMFFQECDDLLEGLTSGLNDLENGSDDPETVNSMFRSVHSIKGGAGAFGLEGVVKFSHALENVLDDMRSGKTAADENVVALLFSAADHLCDLVEGARDGAEHQEGHGASVLSDLKLLTQSVNGAEESEEEPAPDFEPLTLEIPDGLPSLLDDDADETDDLGTDVGDPVDLAPLEATGLSVDETELGGAYTIKFRATEGTYLTGNDPVLLFRALAGLGKLTITPELTGLHPLGEDDWREPQLSWHLSLELPEWASESAIQEVFEFVDGNCDLEIIAPSESNQGPGAVPPLPEPPKAEADDINTDSEVSEPDSLTIEKAASEDAPSEAPAPTLPEGASETPAPTATQSDSSTTEKKVQPARSSTIRVELQRVDRLINLVGELVIGEAMLRQSVTEQPNFSGSAIEEAMGQLKQLSGVIQESVMAIRAQPVRSLFQRMSRIVRETAREAGKQARLVTIGDATEVDKTVTERLVEPLTHMVRNAIDHGLETPEARRAAGKPERGDVTLVAAHRSGRVVITLSDDGGGIDRPRVRATAEEKGLIRPDEELTDAEIDNLLFRPGFSTAKEVSNLSGRGVGMDVVRSEIQALGGRVNIQSTPGQGTQLSISLPLTLAVMEGMVVDVEGEALVVPTLALRETLQPGQASIHELCDGDLVLSMNDELVPIIDLGVALGLRQQPSIDNECALLLIESESERRTALAVDRIVDQREVVIKGLEQNYGHVPGIAAATILGDGSIALIVDTDQMIAPPAPRSHRDPALATPAANAIVSTQPPTARVSSQGVAQNV